ncbi:SLC13 family permease [Mesorhizobium sp. YM1C-6-2]|uniref:SLC13 family permease n=1 Tax=Mesorhizobium sp. YM1C-6-2 TaxID=1827501 RepID=UPI000EF22307|nr:SLC13 family permease [Mesorhizobium sp. YM1C-6-2]RLP26910.1 anion transporter [Mesorhizobium sp. YM1C-6-2]
MTTLAVAVFVLTYVGMALGRVPGLAIDRTGVALLGLIVLLASGDLTLDQAGDAVDMPTITLLFALMILSAQFEHSGFYGWVASRIIRATHNPKTLLAVLIAVTGALAAVFTNDVVVFALTPLVAAGLMSQKLDPRPYLIGLAGAANAGSAATLIGNPQNILIGQAGGLDFWTYFVLALPPTLICLAITFVAILATWRLAPAERAATDPVRETEIDRFQMAKGLAAVVLLIGLFLTPLPRELSALAVAGLLLMSRRLSSRAMIGAVDWQLLLLFACLFGVTAAFANTGLAQEGLAFLASHGLMPDRLSVLAPLTLAASNTIGNVPAVILIIQLMPDLSDGVLAALALLSTFAGNLLLTGSLCNIIVAERAAQAGAPLSFADFARSGVPMTLASMAAAAAWLWATGLVSF